MSRRSFFDGEELENLRSLKRDLVDPVKSFVDEVYSDSVGDAKRFYADRAREAGQSARRAREEAAQKLAALKREQEELRKRRSEMIKRAAIVLALLAAAGLVIISAALNAAAP